MARPATGSARWNPTEKIWEARVTIPGVGRTPPKPLPGVPPCLVIPNAPPSKCSCASCAQARRVAKIVSDRSRKEGRVPEYTGEVANEWYERYHAYQVELGQTDAAKKRHRWLKWIAPKIGTKAMAAVTSDDIEDIRDALDNAIAAWKRDGGKSAGKRGSAISGKTAMNVWSCLTSSFKAATSSKRRGLRVIDGKPNPCTGVLAPGDRESRQARRKTFLYPRESAALLACEAVPLEWREIYALALYTYLRPGELRVLTWADVDVDAGVLHITKAWDYADAKIKPPKTRNGVRKVPIEASLRPLLDRMRKGKDADAVIVPALAAFGEDHLAEQFREHLELALVKRAELHTSTRTHVQANFRSFRDSGITYLAIGGLSVDKVMRRAGHDMVQTTMGYVKQAEDITGDLGVPFGPLPEGLLSSGGSGQDSGSSLNDSATLECRRRESKPDDECPEVSNENAPSIEKTGSVLIDGCSVQATVPGEIERPAPQPVDADEALRGAIVAALYAGDLERVKALVGVLESSPKLAPVFDMMTRQPKR